jgi:pantetheine-phosphate adenylyltransferase
MKKAVYPGSFDPITVGHLDIIKRLSPLYDEVIVLVSHSPNKSYLFSAEERKKMLEKSLEDLKNVKVDIHEGLTVDYLRRVGAKVIVRGLRAVVDFEYEMAMASMNKKLAPEIETALIFASPDCYYISSRAIKEIARFGGNLDGLVPTHVHQQLLNKLQIPIN